MVKCFNMNLYSLEDFSLQILFSGVVLLLGAIFAKISEKLAFEFCEKIYLREILKRNRWEKIFGKIDVIKLFQEIIKLFFLFLSLMIVFEIFGAEKISDIFFEILKYYPNILVSILFFLFGVYFLDFSKKIFIGTFDKEKITFFPIFSKTLEIGVWILVVLAIFYQLKIARDLVLIIFAGVVFTFSLIFGLSLGLGGKDLAAKFLKEIEQKLQK